VAAGALSEILGSHAGWGASLSCELCKAALTEFFNACPTNFLQFWHLTNCAHQQFCTLVQYFL